MASGICVLMAGVVALLQSKGGFQQCKSTVSVNTAPPEQDDIMWMFQAKGVVKLAQGRNQPLKPKSPNFAIESTATRTPGGPTESSSLTPNAEPAVMTTAGSDDVGGRRSDVGWSFLSLEMWRTRAKSVLGAGGESDKILVGFGALGIYAIIGLSYGFATVIVTRWANSHSKQYAVENGIVEEEPGSLPIERSTREPNQERVSELSREQTSILCEECYSLPMSELRQGNAIVQGDSEVVVVGRSGDTRFHSIISNSIDSTWIEVSTLQDKGGQRVNIGPPTDASPANDKSLEILGQSAVLFGEYIDFHGPSACFKGTLEEQSLCVYTVLRDQQPVMYLRTGPNANQVTVTTGQGKLLALVGCSGIGCNAGEYLEIRVDDSADAIIVLACALAVVIRTLV